MSKQAEAGKGDSPRKMQDYQKFSDNYDRIFKQSGPLAKKRLEELNNDKPTQEEATKS